MFLGLDMLFIAEWKHGTSETTSRTSRAPFLSQGGTAVLPAHRHQGLGRWIKAALLERVLREQPEVRFVRTDNADRNAAMLAINTAMGFKPYLTETQWQIETATARDYLDKKVAADSIGAPHE